MSLSTEQRTELTSALHAATNLSPDQKSALLELLNNKRYGLVWEKKPEEANELMRDQLPVFTEVPERRIEGATADAPNHVLIEGDNLHALTALQYTHAGMVDVIYIDPPYNTGNDDFSYHDAFSDSPEFIGREHKFRHSTWLSFVHRRLILAKPLLKNTGVIFISIDDNEQAQLKLLCDEVFGEEACAGLYSWVRKKKPAFLSKKIIKVTEYILCYQKNAQVNVEMYGEAAYASKAVPLLNRPNRRAILNFPANTLKVGRGVPDGVIRAGNFGDGELSVGLLADVEVTDGIINKAVSLEGRFRWSQEFLNNEIESGSVFVASDTFRINVYQSSQADKVKAPSSLLTPERGIPTNEDASEELRDVFASLSELPFSFPKPTGLISYLVNTVTRNNNAAIILDFFAGSGTTLHATMALNAEDGGKRQCILVTNNENKICEKVTYERNKRVIQGYTNVKGVQVPGLTDNTLRYYKTEFVSREPTLKNRRDLVKRSVSLIGLKESAYQVQPNLSGEGYTMIIGQDSNVFVVYDPDAVPDVVDHIRDLKKPCKVYVFSPGTYAWDEDFEEVRSLVELIAMPEAYYAALENDLPKRNLLAKGAQ